jgi:primase-polymerase (primpol)-like protein
MKNKRFTFTLENSLKEKLVHDSLKSKYSSISAYLNELIKRGLPSVEPMDVWMKYIDKKIDCLSDNITAFHNHHTTLLGKIFKRVYVNYRLAGYILARLFHHKSGLISQENKDAANKIIEVELEETENRFPEL